MQKDTKTLAYVLRRTNYGEADRILNLITPSGKISAIAKGARKAKSKLAGGIEMFSLIEINIHSGKGELGVVTSARMLKYYNNILADYERMELASWILKRVSILAESSDNPDYYKIVDQALSELNAGTNVAFIKSWAVLNIRKAMGEEVNVFRDTDGEKLIQSECYSWDGLEMAFSKNPSGEYAADEIKMLRLMLSTDLNIAKRVKGYEEMLPKILAVAKTLDR